MPETEFLFFGSFVPADRWERETHAPSRESPAAQQPTPATDSPADPQGDHRKAVAAGRKSSGNWPKQYSKSTFSLWKPIISYNFGHAAGPQETPAAAATELPTRTDRAGSPTPQGNKNQRAGQTRAHLLRAIRAIYRGGAIRYQSRSSPGPDPRNTALIFPVFHSRELAPWPKVLARSRKTWWSGAPRAVSYKNHQETSLLYTE